jgi:hypothetical protein
VKRDLILILKITNFLKKSYPPFFFPKNVAGSRKWGLLPLKTGVFPKAFKFQKRVLLPKGAFPEEKNSSEIPQKKFVCPRKNIHSKKIRGCPKKYLLRSKNSLHSPPTSQKTP